MEAMIHQAGEAGSYAWAAWIFLRVLGLIYLAAFISLAVQVKGLVGWRGILPVKDFLFSRQQSGLRRWLRVPTLCWWNRSDAFLLWQSWGGAALSLLLFAGVAPLPVLVALWILYLSLFNACRIFLGYQWDILLLETGFLAIFLAPWELLPSIPPRQAPSLLLVWLLWWLLFRLMFSSGWVKLRSGDRTWKNLTALEYHYETQPLPTRLSWHMHQLPAWFHKLSLLFMFTVELIVPFLIFLPPPLRHWAGGLTILLMLLILLTGNYCFFNLLGIALCVTLFADAALLPIIERIAPDVAATFNPAPTPDWLHAITIPVAAVIGLLSLEVLARLFRFDIRWPLLARFIERLDAFRLVNSYGLFAVMTVERPEIIVEGSDDGVEWREYEFKWKPGDVKRAPRFVAPHQPRLDWQMWFAALGYFQNNPWFGWVLMRLLEGSPDVLRLLRRNPFPDYPPQFIRARVYDYRFTRWKERRETGAWWRREARGLYSPILKAERGPSPTHKEDRSRIGPHGVE